VEGMKGNSDLREMVDQLSSSPNLLPHLQRLVPNIRDKVSGQQVF